MIETTPNATEPLDTYEQPTLTPEDEIRLELSALLGAYNDTHGNNELTQMEKNARDDVIFGGLKQTLVKAESLQNISLLGEIQERISMQEAFCQCSGDDNFSKKLDGNNILRSKNGGAEEEEDDGTDKSKKHSKDKARKKKRRPIRRGWLSYLAG